MEKVTIACVYWEGNFKPGNPYSPLWVEKLRAMVERNLGIPFRFVCLSNMPIRLPGVKHIPLKHNLPGWWSKMELYRPDIFNTDIVLYLDLDMVIIANLSPFIDFLVTGMALVKNFNNWRPKKKAKYPDVRQGYNSSVMVFEQWVARDIWDKFSEAPKKWMEMLRGDQDFLQECFPGMDTFPQDWVVKMRSCINHQQECIPKKDTKIILCMPCKNHEAAKKWKFIRDRWR